jgi:hypothetical protein
VNPAEIKGFRGFPSRQRNSSGVVVFTLLHDGGAVMNVMTKTISKMITGAALAGALLFATPHKAEAQRVGFGISVGVPAPVYGPGYYGAGYVAPYPYYGPSYYGPAYYGRGYYGGYYGRGYYGGGYRGGYVGRGYVGGRGGYVGGRGGYGGGRGGRR